MSALLDGLYGALGASPAEDSGMSGSFQSGFGGGDYDYGGSGGAGGSGGSAVDRDDHYGGHSGYHHHSGHGYHDEKCCPLVVDALCVAAILLSVAGATTLLGRSFQIELCNLAGQGVNNCVGRRRKKRAFGHDDVRLPPMIEGKHCEHSWLALCHLRLIWSVLFIAIRHVINTFISKHSLDIFCTAQV